MDRISKEEFIEAILSSNILAPFLERDPVLRDLIKTPNHPNIHYFETPAKATELLPALKHRLHAMPVKNISHNLEATQQLVAFMEKHPDSLIYNVTFNCPAQHYGVRCGLDGKQLHVICFMTGGHIPDELLRESTT